MVRQFAPCKTPEELYRALIALGRTQLPLAAQHKTPEHKIDGCQSTAYLYTEFQEGLIYFHIEADALISAGLGQLITRVYSKEPPEAILKCPTQFLQEIGLEGALSPSRSNGLANMLLQCQREALGCLVRI